MPNRFDGNPKLEELIRSADKLKTNKEIAEFVYAHRDDDIFLDYIKMDMTYVKVVSGVQIKGELSRLFLDPVSASILLKSEKLTKRIKKITGEKGFLECFKKHVDEKKISLEGLREYDHLKEIIREIEGQGSHDDWLKSAVDFPTSEAYKMHKQMTEKLAEEQKKKNIDEAIKKEINVYQVLGMKASTIEEANAITRAEIMQAFKYISDKNHGHATEEITKAFEILQDKESRSSYNEKFFRPFKSTPTPFV